VLFEFGYLWRELLRSLKRETRLDAQQPGLLDKDLNCGATVCENLP